MPDRPEFKIASPPVSATFLLTADAQSKVPAPASVAALQQRAIESY
ncbi:hypothetical protein [Microcoleus sp. K4-C2]